MKFTVTEFNTKFAATDDEGSMCITTPTKPDGVWLYGWHRNRDVLVGDTGMLHYVQDNRGGRFMFEPYDLCPGCGSNEYVRAAPKNATSYHCLCLVCRWCGPDVDIDEMASMDNLEQSCMLEAVRRWNKRRASDD